MHLFLYVDDVDARLARAIAVGATVTMSVEKESYGRGGGIKGPFGLTRWLSTRKT